MGIVLLVLLAAIILGGIGFALHALWWLALAVFVVWLIAYAVQHLTHHGHDAKHERRSHHHTHHV